MDTIANMLVSLKNAQQVGKKRIAVPYSKAAVSLAQFFQEKGLVVKIREQEGPRRKLIITLNYADDKPRLNGLRRISKPGQRRYVGKDEIPYSFDGFGFLIISTSRGLVDDKTARRDGIGGEIICEVW